MQQVSPRNQLRGLFISTLNKVLLKYFRHLISAAFPSLKPDIDTVGYNCSETYLFHTSGNAAFCFV
jgi:hypothetical protein